MLWKRQSEQGRRASASGEDERGGQVAAERCAELPAEDVRGERAAGGAGSSARPSANACSAKDRKHARLRLE